MAMSYTVAIEKAWEDLLALNPPQNTSVKFLADEYCLDLPGRKVFSLACNIPAKEFNAILILHYLIQKLKGLPALSGEWVSFKELPTGESYYPSFRKRVIEPIARKYGSRPEGILEVLERLPGKKTSQGDVGIVLEAFEGVPILIALWRPDEEFGPEVNVLFDRNIAQIFCTEDIVVLAGIIAASL